MEKRRLRIKRVMEERKKTREKIEESLLCLNGGFILVLKYCKYKLCINNKIWAENRIQWEIAVSCKIGWINTLKRFLGTIS